MKLNHVLRVTVCAAAMAPLVMAAPALAQERAQEGAASVLAAEVVVITATKRGEENVQDVPLAITAFGSEQLEALNFRDLQSLSYSMPNVHLEDIGTTPAVANFSIRGLGINSSIPSIDPTVGVFVDGVYMGITSGVVLDNFDIEAIEVLRGPQGVLFGRNVTGGAVLIRTRAPTKDISFDARAAVETGTSWVLDATLSGPILGDALTGKVAVYTSDDSGWLTNDFDGSEMGAARQTTVRGALQWTPADSLDMILRYEHGEADGDGPAGQNHAQFSRDSFDFAINQPGFFDNAWDQVAWETNWDAPFGGVVTNVFGWRAFDGLGLSDIDATTGTAFHARLFTKQDQISDELRYAGTFGPVELTTGLYYFQQNLLYIEERLLDTNLADANPAILRVGGGDGDFSTWGAFVAADWRLNDLFTINLGVRYSHEEKDASISRIRRAADPVGGPGQDVPNEGVIGGDIDAQTLAFTDPGFALSWNDISPRVGLQWTPDSDTQVYAFWAKGFRSGGLNFRHTALGLAPSPFDAEEQNSYEIGLKRDFAGGKVRLNLAVFQNEIAGMQREQNLPDPVSGVQQLISNAGDATISGAELEGRVSLTDNLLLTVQAGYTTGEYDAVFVDLNGNGVVGDSADLALEIPRLSPWTYGLSLVYDLPLGAWGMLSSRIGYNHRDEAFYTDNNAGFLNAVDMVDANFTFKPDSGPWSIALYGSNLTDEPSYGGDTQLPNIAAFGGDGAGPLPLPTFSPLNKGRVVGAELRVKY